MFSKIAEERGTEVFLAEESLIPIGYMEKFSYDVFPNNIAVYLAVAGAPGIDNDRAPAGIPQAKPDPGVATITSIGNTAGKAFFNKWLCSK